MFLSETIPLVALESSAAYYCLQGNYEKAFEVANVLDDDVSIKSKVCRQSEYHLKKATTLLSKWCCIPETESSEKCANVIENFMLPIKSQAEITGKLLDLQFDAIGTKSSIKYFQIEDESYLKLKTLEKLNEWTKLMPHLDSQTRENIELAYMGQIIANGNLEFAQKCISSVKELLPLLTSKPEFQCILAEFYFKMDDMDFCAKICANLLENFIPLASPAEKKSQILKIYQSIIDKLEKSDELYQAFLAEAPMLDLSDSKSAVIQNLCQQFVQLLPESKESWLQFGNFAYKQSSSTSISLPNAQDIISSFKSLSADCYKRFFQVSDESRENSLKANNDSTSKRNKITAMIRTLELLKEGYIVDPEQVIITPYWLLLLPAMSQIPSLRAHLLKKFPSQSALYLMANDSQACDFRRSLRRKTLFDPKTYISTDVNEENLNSATILQSQCVICDMSLSHSTKSSAKAANGMFNYEIKSPLPQISPAVRIFAKELQRISTSGEEIWYCAMQRIMYDWNKRISTMKRDGNAKELQSGKIQAYIYPVGIMN